MRWTVLTGLRAHPWVLSTALVWWLVAVLVWAVARAGQRRGGRPPASGWALLFWCALGGFVAVTLTPSASGSGLAGEFLSRGRCYPQWPRTGFGLWAPNPERRWNVLLGVPLGLAALAWLLTAPGDRRRRFLQPVAAVGVALAVPVAVELAQRVLPGLGRLCAVVDAVDNVSGVVIGFVLAAVGALVHGVLRSSPRRA